MAEEKKPDKPKDAPAPAPKDPFVEIVLLFAMIFIGSVLLNNFFGGLSRISSLNRSSFTPSGILTSHTRPIASLQNPTGSQVVSMKKTTVFKSPGSQNIGSQKINSRGKIVQGPVTVGGIRYYLVDYDTGVDGWVSESDIGYLESEPNRLEQLVISAYRSLPIIHLVSFILCCIFLFFIFYIRKLLVDLYKKEEALLYPKVEAVIEEPVNPKWEKILTFVESQSDGDWRTAIIEADIMLDDLLNKLSLPGDTMGDKLKAVEKSDFLTIENAWEAHKIRNQIAHDGQDFMLSQREARRVIDLYRSIFEEFEMI